MFELIKAGGWLMLPIITGSILAMTIIFERLWILRESRITPDKALSKVKYWINKKKLDEKKMYWLKNSSPLGSMLFTVLDNKHLPKDSLQDKINDQASIIFYKLESYLNILGTIAMVSPLLGLLGTVIGMIDVFTVIVQQGSGNSMMLAGGISKALITTASGLIVAIFSIFFSRYFTRKIDYLVLIMEQETTNCIDFLKENR